MIRKAVNERDLAMILQKARRDTDLNDMQFVNLLDEVEAARAKEDTK